MDICPFCKRRLTVLLDIELALEELPLLKAPCELADRVLQALHVRGKRDIPGRTPPARPPVPIPPLAEAASSQTAYNPRWKRELTHGMLALAATYLFIASGIIGRITSLNTRELESGVRFGAAQLFQAMDAVSRHLLS
ncbi:hypothetical protein [Paenibacillus filicis]|uniref:hypothetical protein n=1 Tax=Paenibacillus filicis TaxID=669464 RepID=UPI00311A1736